MMDLTNGPGPRNAIASKNAYMRLVYEYVNNVVCRGWLETHLGHSVYKLIFFTFLVV